MRRPVSILRFKKSPGIDGWFSRAAQRMQPLVALYRRHGGVVFTVRLAIAAVAVAVAFRPESVERLEYHRAGIGDGQLWRLFTGHFVHWNTDHLLWDVLMFVVLGCLIPSTRQWYATVIGSIVAISAVLWLGMPAITQYRGLSGIDTGLFVVVAAHLVRQNWQANRRVAVAALVFFAGLVGKLTYEALTGHCLFVDDHSAGFVPLVSAHIAGAVVGLMVVAGSLYGSWRGGLRRQPVG